MSEQLVVADPAGVAAPSRRPTPGRRPMRTVVTLAGAVVALALPFYAESFWLRLALFAFAGAVATLGLTLLLGQAGQLSLGHSFFVAVGAYGYTVLAAPESTSSRVPAGLALPPPVAAVLAVLLAGAAGVLFAPVAARLRGIYLGVASLALVFGGQHVLFNAPALTGGFNGRNVPALLFDNQPVYVLGVPFGRAEKLWYLGLSVTLVAYLCCRSLIRGRTGRALRAVRERELMAGIIGVPVTRYKAYAFALSSMYAGLGGVLLALAFGRIVPETFGVALAIEYLMMAVIGGLGSPAGAVIGAVFVSCLPSVLERYAGALPGLAPAGTEGISPAVAAKLAFGVAVVALLLLEPDGATGALRRLRRLVSPTPPKGDRDVT